jgi:hypothetical protein
LLSYFTLNVLVTFFCVPACLPVCFADCLTFAKVISLYHRFCLCRVSMMVDEMGAGLDWGSNAKQEKQKQHNNNPVL